MFAAEYSAAVHVDVVHPLSLSAVEYDPEPKYKKKTATVSRPKPQVDEFVKRRAPIRNLMATVGDWNLACNNRTDVFSPATTTSSTGSQLTSWVGLSGRSTSRSATTT